MKLYNMVELDISAQTLIEGITIVTFDNNRAFYGGAIVANDYSNIAIKRNSSLSFASNEAAQYGGAAYIYSHCIFVILC